MKVRSVIFRALLITLMDSVRLMKTISNHEHIVWFACGGRKGESLLNLSAKDEASVKRVSWLGPILSRGRRNARTKALIIAVCS